MIPVFGCSLNWDNDTDENVIESVPLTYEALELVQ